MRCEGNATYRSLTPPPPGHRRLGRGDSGASPSNSRDLEETVHRFVQTLVITLVVGAVGSDRLLAQSGASPQINACSLLPKEEVKRHLPWEPMFDQMRLEENSIAPAGSACGYPTVNIQVVPSTSKLVELARKQSGLEPVSGIGDEAFFRNNADRTAELLVRKGKHVLMLQAPASNKIASVKPGVLSLAKALVAKLP